MPHFPLVSIFVGLLAVYLVAARDVKQDALPSIFIKGYSDASLQDIKVLDKHFRYVTELNEERSAKAIIGSTCPNMDAENSISLIKILTPVQTISFEPNGPSFTMKSSGLSF